ncbi:nuclear transport factor 2 family protein [Micromonospora sp. NPDC005206]|uniref:nuclear transport factor 2 family protein n=1 Tax=Micromonospora sp. NPDC005206 TaxID=3157022 RepID=UPI0033A1E251
MADQPGREAITDVINRYLITELLARYCEKLDEYDIAALADVFADDCVMDQGPGRGGPIKGRDKVLAGMKARQALFRRTQHILGQTSLRFDAGGANALTYVTAWHQGWDMTTGVARLRYRDRLVLRVDGWLIQSRRAEALGAEGFDESQWNWVARKAPDDSEAPMNITDRDRK